MKRPLTAMTSYLEPDLDLSFYDPFHGPPDLLDLEAEGPEHVEEIIGDFAHEEQGLGGQVGVIIYLSGQFDYFGPEFAAYSLAAVPGASVWLAISRMTPPNRD